MQVNCRLLDCSAIWEQKLEISKTDAKECNTMSMLKMVKSSDGIWKVSNRQYYYRGRHHYCDSNPSY